MRLLSNENLLETFYKSIQLKLDEDFIQLLWEEIQRRDLPVEEPLSSVH